MPRIEKKIRKESLLAAAMRVATRVGYTTMTRTQIAAEAGVSDALVSVHWGSMEAIRKAVMRHAVTTGDTAIVAQGLAVRDRIAVRAHPDLKKAVAASIV